ncbi:hypothetical protein LX12_004362 [Williamsia serinedens]|uniref:Uncharacterized protein n=1 Tax=Williamsia serinedens TaxID=391736 RepID=A0ABT1HB41_9NOCA|nr:hypothetical protein [Williamsia serinedens]
MSTFWHVFQALVLGSILVPAMWVAWVLFWQLMTTEGEKQ